MLRKLSTSIWKALSNKHKPSNISCSLCVSYPLFVLFCGYSAGEKHQTDSPWMLLFAFWTMARTRFLTGNRFYRKQIAFSFQHSERLLLHRLEQEIVLSKSSPWLPKLCISHPNNHMATRYSMGICLLNYFITLHWLDGDSCSTPQ